MGRKHTHTHNIHTTFIHSERKEGVGSEERAPILACLPLDCASEIFSWMARTIHQIGADEGVDDGEVEQERLILESGVAIEECPLLSSCPSTKG